MKRQTAQPISKLIKDFRKTLGTKRAKEQPRLFSGLTQAWREIVGEKIARHAKLVGEKQNILYVKVDSAPILAELANFRKREILQKLHTGYPTKTYRDINFIPA